MTMLEDAQNQWPLLNTCLKNACINLSKKQLNVPTIALNGYNIPWNPLGTVSAAALHLSYFTKGSLDGSFQQSKNCIGEKPDEKQSTFDKTHKCWTLKRETWYCPISLFKMLTWSFVKWNSIVTKKQKRILNEKGLLVGCWLWIGGIETHLTKSTPAILLCGMWVKSTIQYLNIIYSAERVANMGLF